MMDLNNLIGILAQATETATKPNPTGQQLQLLLMMGMGLVLVYLMMIRPQNKRNREQAEMLKSVKAGDKIQTGSGIIATVVNVKEKSMTIRSADSKMEINKAAVTEILERSGESSAS